MINFMFVYRFIVFCLSLITVKFTHCCISCTVSFQPIIVAFTEISEAILSNLKGDVGRVKGLLLRRKPKTENAEAWHCRFFSEIKDMK